MTSDNFNHFVKPDARIIHRNQVAESRKFDTRSYASRFVVVGLLIRHLMAQKDAGWSSFGGD
jgi:hypothetical protein